MFLMELRKNIHDGHGPRVLGPEDLQQKCKYKFIMKIMKNLKEHYNQFIN